MRSTKKKTVVVCPDDVNLILRCSKDEPKDRWIVLRFREDGKDDLEVCLDTDVIPEFIGLLQKMENSVKLMN